MTHGMLPSYTHWSYNWVTGCGDNKYLCYDSVYKNVAIRSRTFSRHIPLYFMFGIETCVVIKWTLSGSGRNFSKCLCHLPRPSCYPGLSAVTKIPKCSHNSNVYIHQNTNQQSRWSIMKIITVSVCPNMGTGCSLNLIVNSDMICPTKYHLFFHYP